MNKKPRLVMSIGWVFKVRCKDCKNKFKSSDLLGDEEVPMYHTSKKCMICNGKLELSRWKECGKCKVQSNAYVQNEYEVHV